VRSIGCLDNLMAGLEIPVSARSFPLADFASSSPSTEAKDSVLEKPTLIGLVFLDYR